MLIGIDGTPFFRKTDGIGRYNHDLLVTLARLHPDVTFVIAGFRGDTPEPDLCSDLPTNVRFHYAPLPRKVYQGIFSRIRPLSLGRLLPRFTHFIHGNFTLFPYIKAAATQKFLIIHDTTFLDMPEVVTPKNLQYLTKRVPWSIRKADHIGTISDFTYQRVVDEYPFGKKKLRSIGTGVQAVYFKSGTKKPPSLPKKYILAIGTLEPRKNLSSLVKAHGILPLTLQQKYPLVLGGSLGWDNRELREQIEQSTYVHHIGYVKESELPGLYQHASLFVFPSRYEGFGIPLLEAMASQTPIIASNIPLFQSIAKTHARYVDTDSPEALSASIEQVLMKPPSDRALKAAQEHARLFTWEAVAKKLWQEIKEDS